MLQRAWGPLFFRRPIRISFPLRLSSWSCFLGHLAFSEQRKELDERRKIFLQEYRYLIGPHRGFSPAVRRQFLRPPHHGDDWPMGNAHPGFEPGGFHGIHLHLSRGLLRSRCLHGFPPNVAGWYSVRLEPDCGLGHSRYSGPCDRLPGLPCPGSLFCHSNLDFRPDHQPVFS